MPYRIRIINPNSNSSMTDSLRAPIDSLNYNDVCSCFLFSSLHTHTHNPTPPHPTTLHPSPPPTTTPLQKQTLPKKNRPFNKNKPPPIDRIHLPHRPRLLPTLHQQPPRRPILHHRLPPPPYPLFPPINPLRRKPHSLLQPPPPRLRPP